MALTHTYYQVGTARLHIRTDAPDVLADFDELYAAFRAPGALDRAWTIDVRHRLRRPWQPLQLVIRSAGIPPRPVERAPFFLPEMQAHVDRLVIQRSPQLYIMHAAAMQYGGQAVILPAGSGTGKTTLAAALLARGWRYLTDELALLEPHSLTVLPFPKALSIKASGFDLIRSLGLQFAGDKRHSYRGRGELAFCAAAVRPGAIGQACPLRWVVLLHRPDPPVPARIQALPAAQAAIYCYGIGLNTLAHRQGGLDTARAVACRAHCRWLFVGSLEESCALLESAVEQDLEPQEWSAPSPCQLTACSA